MNIGRPGKSMLSIKAYREALKMPQTAFSDYSGVKRTTLQRIEQAQDEGESLNFVKFETACKLVSALLRLSNITVGESGFAHLVYELYVPECQGSGYSGLIHPFV